MNPQLRNLGLVFGGGLSVSGFVYGLSRFGGAQLDLQTCIFFGILAAVAVAAFFLVMYLVKRSRTGGKAVSGISEKVDKAIRELEVHEKGLYERPWVVVAGEPGSGKTEMLKRCPGLLDDRFPEPVEGEGGTEHMNWWFVRGAVVIDTAGALLQLTDARGESASPSTHADTAHRRKLWQEFLESLKAKRPLCPINGMILVIPVTSLVSKTQEQAEYTARQLYEQIGRLTQDVLECRFPLTVIVSKCDRLDGFEAFFQNVAGKKEQHAGFGWSADEVEGYPRDKFEAFLRSLRQKLRRFRMNLLYKPPQLQDEGGFRLDATDSLFAFPHQMEAMIGNLQLYLDEIFRQPDRMFLRGVYFSSNLQQQLDPLDLQLAQILRRDASSEASSAVDRHVPMRQDSRSYFVRFLLEKKVFLEQGLVTFEKGTGKQIRNRRAVLLTTVVAVLMAGFIGVTFLASQALEKALGRHVRAWERIAAVMIPPAAAPQLVSSNGPSGQRFSYHGRDVPQPWQSEGAEAQSNLGELLQLASEHAFSPLETPVMFALPRRLSAQGDLDQLRINAFRSVVDRALLIPLLRAGRERITAPAEDPMWVSRGLAGPQLLAELIRCEQLMLLNDPAAQSEAQSRGLWPSPIVAAAGVGQPSTGRSAQGPMPDIGPDADGVLDGTPPGLTEAPERVFSLRQLGLGVLHGTEGKAATQFVEDLNRLEWQSQVDRLYPVDQPEAAQQLIERADTQDPQFARLQAAGQIRQGVVVYVNAWRTKLQSDELGPPDSLVARLQDLNTALAAYESAESELTERGDFRDLSSRVAYERERRRYEDALAALARAADELSAAMSAVRELAGAQTPLPELLDQAERETRQPLEAGFDLLIQQAEGFRRAAQSADTLTSPPSQAAGSGEGAPAMRQETPSQILSGLYGRLNQRREELWELFSQRMQQLRDALGPRLRRYLASGSDQTLAFQNRLASWRRLEQALQAQPVSSREAIDLAGRERLRVAADGDAIRQAGTQLMQQIRPALVGADAAGDASGLDPWLEAARLAIERRRRTDLVEAALSVSALVPNTLEGWRESIRGEGTRMVQNAGPRDPFPSRLPEVPMAEDASSRRMEPAFHPRAAGDALQNAVSLHDWVLGLIEAEGVLDPDGLRAGAEEIRAAGRDYLHAYADYWLNELSRRDRYQPVNTWRAFHQRLLGMQRDQVDAARREMEDRRVMAVRQLFAAGSPAVRWVDTEWAEARRKEADAIEARLFRPRLNPPDLPADWRALGADRTPALANLLQRLDSYMRPLLKTNGEIPFWRDFALNGLELLSEQGRTELRDDINHLLERYKKFPLCRDASEQLSGEEFRATRSLLKRLGERRGGGALRAIRREDKRYIPEAYSAIEQLRGEALISERHQRWLDQIAAMSKLFAGEQTPVAGLYVTNLEDQQQRVGPRGELIAQDARFIVLAGRRDQAMSGDPPLPGKPPRPLKRRRLALPHQPGLTISFYRDAGLRNQVMQTQVDGPWGLLQKAIAAGFDAQVSGYVVPLRSGQQVFWLLLRFDPPLPDEEQWPSSQQWPEPLPDQP